MSRACDPTRFDVVDHHLERCCGNEAVCVGRRKNQGVIAVENRGRVPLNSESFWSTIEVRKICECKRLDAREIRGRRANLDVSGDDVAALWGFNCNERSAPIRDEVHGRLGLVFVNVDGPGSDRDLFVLGAAKYRRIKESGERAPPEVFVRSDYRHGV